MAPAASKVLSEQEYGSMRKAMALKVKCRIVDDGGKSKKRIPLQLMGVHPCNRGSIYPQPDVVKGLGIHLVRWGFCQEEADHQGLAVQEAPHAHGKPEHLRFTTWNQEHCRGSAYLQTCFSAGGDVVYATLSHSHLLLVMLCWITGADWALDAAEEKLRKFCDSDGRLNIDAAVAGENTKELVITCREGLMMEVLSWRIEVEEPTACSLISAALNLKNVTALRNTELTAMAVLSGEITRQKNSNVAQEVAFLTVKNSVADKLDLMLTSQSLLKCSNASLTWAQTRTAM